MPKFKQQPMLYAAIGAGVIGLFLFLRRKPPAPREPSFGEYSAEMRDMDAYANWLSLPSSRNPRDISRADENTYVTADSLSRAMEVVKADMRTEFQTMLELSYGRGGFDQYVSGVIGSNAYGNPNYGQINTAIARDAITSPE